MAASARGARGLRQGGSLRRDAHIRPPRLAQAAAGLSHHARAVGEGTALAPFHVSRTRCSAQRCTADPGPPRTRLVTVPGLQRTTTQSSVRRLRKLICVAALRPGHADKARYSPFTLASWITLRHFGSSALIYFVSCSGVPAIDSK